MRTLFGKPYGLIAMFLIALVCLGCTSHSSTPLPQVTTYKISGSVTGAPAGVSILATPDNIPTKTAADGSYAITGLPNGTYTISASLAGYTFSPEKWTVTVNGKDATGINFTGTAISPTTSSISGTVSGSVVAGVTMTLTPGNIATHTAADGTYRFINVPNGPATVTPSLEGETFSPTHADVVVSGADITGVNFSGTTPPVTLDTGKLLYPCLLPGSTGVYGIWSNDLSTGTKILVEASTAIPDGLIPLRIKKCAYRDTSGIWILSLPTGGLFLAIPVGYTEAPGYLSTTIGSFDVSPHADFAAVVLKNGTGKKDIFLVKTDASTQWTQVTTSGVNTSPVIGAADATNATVLFIKNGNEVWKQVVALNGTTAADSATLFVSGVMDSVRPLSVSADYTMLAFMKSVGGAPHIFVVPLAGGPPSDLGAGSDPHWALDGSNKILYHTADNNLWVMSADGMGKMQVPAQTNPAPLNTGGVVFGPPGY